MRQIWQSQEQTQDDPEQPSTAPGHPSNVPERSQERAELALKRPLGNPKTGPQQAPISKNHRPLILDTEEDQNIDVQNHPKPSKKSKTQHPMHSDSVNSVPIKKLRYRKNLVKTYSHKLLSRTHALIISSGKHKQHSSLRNNITCLPHNR